MLPAGSAAWRSPWLLLVACGVSVLVAVLSGQIAARRAGRTSPVQALRETAAEGTWPHPVRVLLGIVAAGGAGTLMAFTFGQKSPAGQLALALPLLLACMVAVALLGPLLVALVAWLARPLRAVGGPSARLALAAIAAQPRRTASAVIPVALAVAMVGSVYFAGTSIAHATSVQAGSTVTADRVISGTGLGPGALRQVLARPGVRAAAGVAPVSVAATDPDLEQVYGEAVAGGLGFVWLIVWLAVYRNPKDHPKLSPGEAAYIASGQQESVVAPSWGTLLARRQTWAFVMGKFMTDPIWWFYLFWLPKFLDSGFGVKLSGLAAPLVTIYLIADVGSVGGGWLSSSLIKRGWSVNAGRKTAMLIAALLIVPTMFAPQANNMWVAVGIVSVAAAAHQWWSANLFTTVSDMYPRAAVATVVGFGGFAGAMGGMLFQRTVGRILEATQNNYSIIFVVCGLAYVSALLVIQLLVPRMEPAKL